jgi:hypothetical protein
MGKIADFLSTQDDDLLCLVICPNEFDLDTFDDIELCNGSDNVTCEKCWTYALKHMKN